MPRKKTAPEGEESGLSPSAKLKSKFAKDKDTGHGIRLGSDELLSDVASYISTQAPNIDYIIGQPGIPAGKVTTIFGREGSAKSLIGYHLLAQVQKMGGVGILVDTEGRFTKDRFKSIGGDLDELIVVEGLSLEETFKTMEDMIDDIRAANPADLPVLFVYDSLSEAVPDKRLAAEVGGSLPAITARFVGTELPRLKMKLSRHDIALVIINQLRTRVNFDSDPRTAAYAERNKVMGQKQAMIAEWPLLYGSALMLRTNTISSIIPKGGDREHPTGVRVRVENRKCGLSPREMWRAEVDIDYMHGIDLVKSSFDLLEEIGVIEAKGGWYAFKDDSLYSKSFHYEDFADILESLPALHALAAAAPRGWVDGDAEERSE